MFMGCEPGIVDIGHDVFFTGEVKIGVFENFLERSLDALPLRARLRFDGPVSYTHLDVYKRQPQALPGLLFEPKDSAGPRAPFDDH